MQIKALPLSQVNDKVLQGLMRHKQSQVKYGVDYYEHLLKKIYHTVEYRYNISSKLFQEPSTYNHKIIPPLYII